MVIDMPRRPGEMHVWFRDGKLCAVMPALILINEVFEPMWKLKSAEIIETESGTIVCIKSEKRGLAIIRSGKGWGRHGKDKYYIVDFGAKIVKKLVKRPTKKLHGGGWMTCVDMPDSSHLCFDWLEGGRLGVVKTRVRWSAIV